MNNVINICEQLETNKALSEPKKCKAVVFDMRSKFTMIHAKVLVDRSKRQARELERIRYAQANREKVIELLRNKCVMTGRRLNDH